MPSRFGRASSRVRGSAIFLALTLLASLAVSTAALGQPAKPPAGKPGAPPGTGTDMELDPDAKPPPEKPKEETPLPPPEEGAWGVGGKDEEGKFSPQSKKKVEDTEDKTPVKLESPGAAWLDFVLGFGGMRDIHDDAGKSKITAESFIIGFKYRIGDAFTLKARFPLTHASVNSPSGAVVNTNAVGNAELGAQYAIQLTHRLRLPIDLAIDIPSAPGDILGDNVPRAQALVNQAAAFTRGWEENPLFASKRFGFRLGAGITYDREELHIQAGTRVDIMAKTGGLASGVDVQGNALTVRKTTIAWVTNAQIFYDFFGGKLSPGLRAWFVYATLPVTSGSTDYSGPQFVLEPDISGKFGLNADGSIAIRGVLGFILPVAGLLGGQSFKGQSASADGFRARAELLF